MVASSCDAAVVDGVAGGVRCDVEAESVAAESGGGEDPDVAGASVEGGEIGRSDRSAVWVSDDPSLLNGGC